MKFIFLCPGIALLLPLLALSGCGGSGASPNPDVSGPGRVENSLSRTDFYDTQNGNYYDIYVCDPRETGIATVELQSVDFDAYLLVFRKDANGNFELIAQDDDDGEETDAFVEFPIQRGRSYRIIATSASADERGDYDLLLSRELGRPARVLPDAARSAQSFKLPPLPPKRKP
jgi:hypothetical protein